jgi:hypothetical protein
MQDKLDEHDHIHDGGLVGGDGLRGPDKRQAALRDEDRGEPPVMQPEDDLPEGLRRERKGPYDKNVGRNEDATQVPNNGTGSK